ncbi:MAG: HAMP domain-containing sensor histidine kinase [Kiritimatiellia bacterium]
MNVRVPLYGRLLLWFMVNLLLMLALAAWFASRNFQPALDWLAAGPARQRLVAMGEVISQELRDEPADGWSGRLARYDAAHHCTFGLFRGDGTQVAGAPRKLPPPLVEKLGASSGPPDRPRMPARPHRPPSRPGGPGPFGEDPPWDPFEGEPGDPPPPPGIAGRPDPAAWLFMCRTTDPTRYWAGVRVSPNFGRPGETGPLVLLIACDNITGGGLFFDPQPWILFGAVSLLLSALVWMPFAGSISRSIRRVNAAAREIARGRFDVRVPDRRRDELGELGGSVNSMAEQLGRYVERQRHLTSDVAHELCSPIARMQRALGVVEQRGAPGQEPYLAKLDGELQHMARLVEEVLSLSREESIDSRIQATEFSLAELVEEVVAREAGEAGVTADIPADLRVTAIREAVERAVANVLRNAVSYAGDGGPIRILARPVAGGLEITVRDSGPGVPADMLQKIFEPFFRPESARRRSTGGAGLGLAIARRCLESCGGTIRAEAAEPHGLVMRMFLPSAGK